MWLLRVLMAGAGPHVINGKGNGKDIRFCP